MAALGSVCAGSRLVCILPGIGCLTDRWPCHKSPVSQTRMPPPLTSCPQRKAQPIKGTYGIQCNANRCHRSEDFCWPQFFFRLRNRPAQRRLSASSADRARGQTASVRSLASTTPCVTAFSTTRAMYSTYTGPLYQLTGSPMRAASTSACFPAATPTLPRRILRAWRKLDQIEGWYFYENLLLRGGGFCHEAEVYSGADCWDVEAG